MDVSPALLGLFVLIAASLAVGLWLRRGTGPIDLRDPSTDQPLDPKALEDDAPRGLPASAHPSERVYMGTTQRSFGPPAARDYLGSDAQEPDESRDD